MMTATGAARAHPNMPADGRCPFCRTQNIELADCWTGWGMRSVAPCCTDPDCRGHLAWFYTRKDGELVARPQEGWRRA